MNMGLVRLLLLQDTGWRNIMATSGRKLQLSIAGSIFTITAAFAQPANAPGTQAATVAPESSPYNVVKSAYRQGASRNNGRIVGGETVLAYSEEPWQVALVVA